MSVRENINCLYNISTPNAIGLQAIHVTLFFPWVESRGTDLEGPGCPPDCPPVNGLWWWLAWAGWILCIPAIPLVTLLPTAFVAIKWSNLASLFIYRASLLGWLLMHVFLASLNATTSGETIYMTPYVGLALAVTAVILEVVDIIVAAMERRLTRV